jgi:hypothetical protein
VILDFFSPLWCPLLGPIFFEKKWFIHFTFPSIVFSPGCKHLPKWKKCLHPEMTKENKWMKSGHGLLHGREWVQFNDVSKFASASSPNQINYLRPEANSRRPRAQKVVIGCQKIFNIFFWRRKVGGNKEQLLPSIFLPLF